MVWPGRKRRQSEEEQAATLALQADEHERLICFLYLIMRDELPTGKVCKMITEINEPDVDMFKFSNPHLEALARDYANRIREG